MKTLHKQYVRSLIIELLYDEDIRYRMDSYLDRVQNLTGIKIDSLEAMELYEQQVERINRMFCYPQQALEDSNTNGAAEVTPCR